MARDDVLTSIRVPLVTDLIVRYDPADVEPESVEYMSYMENLVAQKLPSGEVAAIPRAGIQRTHTAHSTKDDGRGVYDVGGGIGLIVINYDAALFPAFQTTIGTISTGYQKVHMARIGNELLLVDPQNSDGWRIHTNFSSLSAISDADFPSSLAGGAVQLNGRGYVIDRAGVIYNSALEDLSSWSATEFIEAEREGDGGVFIETHHDHIVAAGHNTIEFFYDAGNSSGSPLSRREDLYYNVGAVKWAGFAKINDLLVLVGQDSAGNVAVYKLENFQLVKISNVDLDALLTNEVYQQSTDIVMCALQLGGKSMVFMTVFDVGNNDYHSPKYTFAYDIEAGLWIKISTDASGYETAFPIITTTLPIPQTSPTTTKFIFPTGELYRENYSNPFDEVSTTDFPINIASRTGWQDGGTNNYKYMRALELVGNVSADTSFTIKYSDTNNTDAAFTNTRTFTHYANVTKVKLTRWGRFIRRNFELSASVSDRVRLDSLEVKVALGNT